MPIDAPVIYLTAQCNLIPSPERSEDWILGYYDPEISMWLSVDPLADEFPAWSPYNYTMNNPINMIDPDGRHGQGIDGVTDDYKLLKNGSLELIRKTDDQTDVIYNEDLTDCMEVEKSFLEESNNVVTGSGANVGYSGKTDKDYGLAIFKFFANNTEEVEWGYSKFSSGEEEYGILHTSLMPERNYGNPVIASKELKNKETTLTSDWHSHPNGRNKSSPPSGFIYSNGEKTEFMYGDQKYFYNMKTQFGERVPNKFFLYDPNKNKSYKYDHIGYQFKK